MGIREWIETKVLKRENSGDWATLAAGAGILAFLLFAALMIAS